VAQKWGITYFIDQKLFYTVNVSSGVFLICSFKVAMLQSGRTKYPRSVPRGDRNSSCSRSFHKHTGAQTASYLMVNEAFLLRNKATESKADYSPPYRAEVSNQSSYTAILLCDFMGRTGKTLHFIIHYKNIYFKYNKYYCIL